MICIKYLYNIFYVFIFKGVPSIFHLFHINLKLLYLLMINFIQHIYAPIITNETKWVHYFKIKNKKLNL